MQKCIDVAKVYNRPQKTGSTVKRARGYCRDRPIDRYNKLWFPVPMYRPGIGKATLDFPRGRVPAGETPAVAVAGIVKKELGATQEAIARIQPLNDLGWAINSSFSNQKLYGFVAELHPTAAVNPESIGATYCVTPEGIRNLLKDLTCL